MWITFEEIKRKQTIKLQCAKCKKVFKRVISKSATVNPFNKNADGQPKTSHEVSIQVSEEVQAELRKKLTEPFFCSKCS